MSCLSQTPLLPSPSQSPGLPYLASVLAPDGRNQWQGWRGTESRWPLAAALSALTHLFGLLLIFGLSLPHPPRTCHFVPIPIFHSFFCPRISFFLILGDGFTGSWRYFLCTPGSCDIIRGGLHSGILQMNRLLRVDTEACLSSHYFYGEVHFQFSKLIYK